MGKRAVNMNLGERQTMDRRTFLKKGAAVGGGLLASPAILSACSGGGSSEESGRQQITITQSTEGFLYTPIYVAQAEGFFEEEGLEAETLVASGGSNVVASVLSGDAEVGATTTSSTIEGVESGRPIKSFAAIMNQYASNVVIKESIALEKGITEDSSVEEKAQALAGLSIGITSPGSGTDTLIRYLLNEKAGLNPDRDARLIPLGGGAAMNAAFRQDDIDAFALSSPTSDQAVVEGDGVMLFNLSEGDLPDLDGISYISLVASESVLEDDPQMIQGVYNAMERTLRFMEDNRERTKEIMREALGDVSQPVYESAFERNYPAYPGTPEISQESYEKNFALSPQVPYGEAVATPPFAE